MPKQSIAFRRFEGLVGSADPRDLPVGSAPHVENIDPVNARGLLRGLPLDDSVGSADVIAGKVQPFGDGTRAALVDVSGSPTIRVATLSNMVTQFSQAVTRSGADCLASDGEAVHIGLGPSSSAKPKWAGEIYHGQFGGAAAGNAILDAEIKIADCVGVYTVNSTGRTVGYLPKHRLDGIVTKFDNSQVALQLGYSYAYFASLVYDGHQEGPLSPIATVTVFKDSVVVWNTAESVGQQTYSAITAANNNILKEYDGGVWPFTGFDWDDLTDDANEKIDPPVLGLAKLNFPIRIRTATGTGLSVLSARVTGINIYRAPIPARAIATYRLFGGDLSTPEPEHLRFIDINDSNWTANLGTKDANHFNLTTDTYKEFPFSDDLPGGSLTFEARTGYPPTLEHMQLHYGLSAVCESFHVVGMAWHKDLKDINTWLFRSKPYRYDTFDWSKEYLVLPSTPTALAYYAGRLYAFAKARTYVINVGSFDIEETWEGVGCSSQQAVVVTDRGMFWSNDQNLYWHDGSQPRPIGAAVLENRINANFSWTGRNVATTAVTVYDVRYDCAIFCYVDGSGAARALMFNLTRGVWTAITFSQGGPFYTGFTDDDGLPRVLMHNGGSPRLFTLFTNGSRRAWDWYTPNVLPLGGKSRVDAVRLTYDAGRPSVSFFDGDPDYTEAHALPAAGSSWSVQETGHTEEVPVELTSGTKLPYQYNFALRISGTGAQDCLEVALIHRPISER